MARGAPTRAASQTELAYAAGFFDGEGSVGVYNDGCLVRVEIGQNRPKPLLYMQEFLGGFYCEHRGFYKLRSAGHTAIRMLTLIRPYVVLKVEEVDLALEFGTLMTGRGYALTDKQRERRLAIATELYALKGAGRNRTRDTTHVQG